MSDDDPEIIEAGRRMAKAGLLMLDTQKGLAPLPWELGPAMPGGEVPPMWCGDRLLVAVAYGHNELRNGKPVRIELWSYEVIVATETGWDLNGGECWDAWGIEDVNWFVRLDKPITKEQVERCE